MCPSSANGRLRSAKDVAKRYVIGTWCEWRMRVTTNIVSSAASAMPASITPATPETRSSTARPTTIGKIIDELGWTLDQVDRQKNDDHPPPFAIEVCRRHATSSFGPPTTGMKQCNKGVRNLVTFCQIGRNPKPVFNYTEFARGTWEQAPSCGAKTGSFG